MENAEKKPIGQIVAEKYPAWEVFENYKIDFYNGGKRTLEEAAKESNIDVQTLLSEIENAHDVKSEGDTNFNSWDLGVLSEYIVKNYHRKADKQIQIVKPALEKACNEHGEQHPELKEIQSFFGQVAGWLAMHQKKEELILFPYIRKMADAKKNNKTFVRPPATKSVENPVDMLMHEHTNQAAALRKIGNMTGEYKAPGYADNSLKETLNILKEMEVDLHKHIHLENNILFPKALKLDKELV